MPAPLSDPAIRGEGKSGACRWVGPWLKTGRKRYVPWSRKLVAVFFLVAYPNHNKHSRAPKVVKAIFAYP